MHNRSLFFGPIAIIIAAVLWSLDGLLRQSLYAAPAITVVTIEHFLGALLFLPILFSKRSDIAAFKKTDWISLLWVSIFGGILGTFLYTSALGSIGYINFSVVVLIQKLQPFFAIILARLLLKERLDSIFIFIASIAFIGGYLISFPDLTPSLSDAGNTNAALLAFGAAACWGTSTVFGKHALRNHSFFTITGLRLMLTALIGILLLPLLTDLGSVVTLDDAQWTALLFITLSTGGVALGIYYFGLKRIPASHATLYELAWPISAMTLDFVIHGTILTPSQYIGSAILFCSLLLLWKAERASTL